MSFYRGMTCENVTLKGDKGTPITAYVARPSGPGPFPGVVLVHHLPGWSEFYIETTRRFAHHGYLAICANLYERAGEGNPDDVAAKVRADGGISDAQMVGDTEAAVKWMRAQSGHNGRSAFRLLLRRRHASSMRAKGKSPRLRPALGRPPGDGKEDLMPNPGRPVKLPRTLLPLLGSLEMKPPPSPDRGPPRAKLKNTGKPQVFRYKGPPRFFFCPGPLPPQKARMGGKGSLLLQLRKKEENGPSLLIPAGGVHPDKGSPPGRL